MSTEYEVHGPHDHAVEHAGAGHHDAHGAAAAGDPFPGRMAVMTAVLAAVCAIFAYQSGNSENLALYYKNEAAIRKTEAANQWAYYQAKGEKQNLAELGAALAANADAQHRFAAIADRYRKEKEPIRANAEALEKAVALSDQRSEKLLHGHHRWAQATTLIQISIALTAITLLTRRRWLLNTSIGIGVFGVVLGGLAFFSL